MAFLSQAIHSTGSTDFLLSCPFSFICSSASENVFRPTKANLDYPIDEFDENDLLQRDGDDIDSGRGRVNTGTTNSSVVGKVPQVKDEASQKKMFDILEREERKRGIA